MAKTNKYTYISLFSSAGVGCYGFKMNDFDCIATNELLKERLMYKYIITNVNMRADIYLEI